ncbi:MAG: hypothetical protein SynsKO_29730 [Synoicihabitans sp.]
MPIQPSPDAYVSATKDMFEIHHPEITEPYLISRERIPTPERLQDWIVDLSSKSWFDVDLAKAFARYISYEYGWDVPPIPLDYFRSGSEKGEGGQKRVNPYCFN